MAPDAAGAQGRRPALDYSELVTVLAVLAAGAVVLDSAGGGVDFLGAVAVGFLAG